MSAKKFMLSILLVEDNLSFALEVEMIINELGYNLIGTAKSAEEAYALLKVEEPDLIISDVSLKGNVDGIEMISKLDGYGGAVIFITQYRDESLYERAKVLKPIAYLVKPFDKFSLQSCIETASMSLNSEARENKNILLEPRNDSEDSFFIRQSNILSKVKAMDIQSVHSDGNYCEFVLKEGKRYVVKMSLVTALKKLPAKYFIRVHQRFALQASLIDGVDTLENKVLIGDKSYPMGRTYRKELLKRFNRL